MKRWNAQGHEHDKGHYWQRKGSMATVAADTRDEARQAYIDLGYLCAPAVRITAWPAQSDAMLSPDISGIQTPTRRALAQARQGDERWIST